MITILWFFSSSLVYTDSIQRKEKVFTVFIKDSVRVDVDLVYNRKEQPVHYFSHVVTPVCEEGICYELIADVSWDLLGNFLDYQESRKDPLTKFDHIRFTPSDHEKMKEILANKTSLLANYKAKDLLDPNVQIKSDVIDGVTGATFKSLSGAVVKGAVYSSHTLWHVVNGEISDEIVKHTETLLNDDLLIQMLQSNNYHLQFFALNKIDTEKEKYQSYLFELIGNGESYVPFFAIEKLPESIWSSGEYQERSAKLLKSVPFEMQNEILNKLEANSLNAKTLGVLLESVEGLRKNQVEKIFAILEKNQKVFSPSELDKIAALLDSGNGLLSDMAYRLLSETKIGNRKVQLKLRNYEKQIK